MFRYQMFRNPAKGIPSEEIQVDFDDLRKKSILAP